MNAQINRRTFLKAAVGMSVIGATGIFAAPKAAALGPVLGTVIDYAAGLPSAASIKAAGHLGAVRYVSNRRPETENWMIGKPVTLAETRSFAAHGLKTASVYQFGKGQTADWMRGAAGATTHAPQAIALHVAAGGPKNRPIYVAIDDNPTRAQYNNQIRPYLRAFKLALEAAGYQLGIYGNYSVIDWAVTDGLGEYFWLHNWGSEGRIHPRTTIHQIRIDKDKVDDVGIDMNNVHARDWGQWTPGNVIDDVVPNIPDVQTPIIPSVQNPLSPDAITEALRVLNSFSS